MSQDSIRPDGQRSSVDARPCPSCGRTDGVRPCEGNLRRPTFHCVHHSGHVVVWSPDSIRPAWERNYGKPRLLDLFCCEGGAGVGYYRAGFDVTGVDLHAQPRYPFRDFHVYDALAFIEDRLQWRSTGGEFGWDAIHASPPCQAYSNAHRIRGNDHERLIAATRELLEATGLPYVIENVGGAKDELRDPVMLCAAMFDRGPTPEAPGLDRHRWFETNWPLRVPPHPEHWWKTTKMGRKPQPGEAMHVVGNFHSPHIARDLMEMPWASRRGLAEAIPPYYTQFIGGRLLDYWWAEERMEAAA
jgi:DNA (cytosine-5)-methyltransferase 1